MFNFDIVLEIWDLWELRIQTWRSKFEKWNLRMESWESRLQFWESRIENLIVWLVNCDLKHETKGLWNLKLRLWNSKLWIKELKFETWKMMRIENRKSRLQTWESRLEAGNLRLVKLEDRNLKPEDQRLEFQDKDLKFSIENFTLKFHLRVVRTEHWNLRIRSFSLELVWRMKVEHWNIKPCTCNWHSSTPVSSAQPSAYSHVRSQHRSITATATRGACILYSQTRPTHRVWWKNANQVAIKMIAAWYTFTKSDSYARPTHRVLWQSTGKVDQSDSLFGWLGVCLVCVRPYLSVHVQLVQCYCSSAQKPFSVDSHPSLKPPPLPLCLCHT